jgi:hypothetical protein
MNEYTTKWHTGDVSLDATLASHFSNMPESPFGLIVLRRLSWIPESEMLTSISYAHIARQKPSFEGNMVEAICGSEFNLYAASAIYPMMDMKPLNDKSICEQCAIRAEFSFWLKHRADK